MAGAVRIGMIFVVFVLASIGWLILAGVTEHRSSEQSAVLDERVGGLWGNAQTQTPPALTAEWTTNEKVRSTEQQNGKQVEVVRIEPLSHSTPVSLDATNVDVELRSDLRRKGFTVARIRKLLQVLKTRFKTRLYDAIEGGGSVTLFIDGENIYAKNDAGDLFSILDNAAQPLMMIGEDIKLRQLIARERPARRRAKGTAASDKRGASQP